MARIRTIKPEFPLSERVGKLSRDARLLFIQLWTIADDEGRTRAASRMLASLLYPYDDDVVDLIDGWLDELERHGSIRRYKVEGSTYLEICTWLEDQKIDRPTPSRIPPYREASRGLDEPSRKNMPDLGPWTLDQDQESLRSRAVADATRPNLREAFQDFWLAYPKRDGANPKAPAEKVFIAAVKAGATPDDIVAGARRCAEKEHKNIGTPYIPQAIKWLRDRRWEDYLSEPEKPPDAGAVAPPGAPSDEELRARYAAKAGNQKPDREEIFCGRNGLDPGTGEGQAGHGISDHSAGAAGVRCVA